MRSSLAGLAALVLVAASAACSQNGTFVVLSIDKTAGVADGQIVRLDTTLTFGDRSASTTLGETGGAPIHFPTDATFKVANVTGSFTAVVIGRDASGVEIARAMGNGTVGKNATTRLALALGGDGSPAMLTADASTKDFGTTVTGMTSAPATLMLTNGGGAASGTLSVTTTGDTSAFNVSGCDGTTLSAGASCAITVVYAPTAAGMNQATITATGMPGGSVTITLTGTAVAPGNIAITPAMGAYNTQLLNTTTQKTFTVTNGGGSASGTLAMAINGSDAAQFALVSGMDGCTGMTLAPAATCTVVVSFKPTSVGNKSASLTATASPGGVGVAALSGTGSTAAGIGFDSTSHGFGTIAAGTSSATFTFTLSNAGTQTTGAVVTSKSGNTADFTVTDSCNGQTLGAACTYVVKFAPTSLGAKSMTVTATASPGGTASFTVSGTGSVVVTVSPTPTGGTVTGGGLNCGTGGSTCSAAVTASPVALTATPATGYTFSSWGGSCSGTSTSCSLPLSASNASVSATFAASGPVPVLHYTFDNTAANSGSLSGYNLTVGGTSSYVAGKVGQAISLGASAYTYTTGAQTLFGGTNGSAWTISFWINTSTPNTSNSFFDFENRFTAPYGGIQLYYSSATTFGLCVASTTNNYLPSGNCSSVTPPSNNAWHNIAFTYAGTGTGTGQGAALVMYIDGTVAFTVNNDANNNPIFSSAVSNQLNIGASGMLVDDFKLYSGSFTQANLCTVAIGGTWNGSTCTLP